MEQIQLSEELFRKSERTTTKLVRNRIYLLKGSTCQGRGRGGIFCLATKKDHGLQKNLPAPAILSHKETLKPGVNSGEAKLDRDA